MQFLNKIISTEGHRFFYIVATTSDNKKAWYFVFIHAGKYAVFDKLNKSAPYDIADYGDILASGYGEFAPDAVIADMNKKYNCNFMN